MINDRSESAILDENTYNPGDNSSTMMLNLGGAGGLSANNDEFKNQQSSSDEIRSQQNKSILRKSRTQKEVDRLNVAGDYSAPRNLKRNSPLD